MSYYAVLDSLAGFVFPLGGGSGPTAPTLDFSIASNSQFIGIGFVL